ncbi:MAG: hypothetical protein IGS03_03230 [Candidatus Sericytochromatia bacterium]|nr:hypothetical protein [Candidatus Sericytochromatia bacterium]
MRRFACTRLYSLSLLLIMLAYVLIPHQGDFLDGLSMQPGLRQAGYHGLHRLQIQNEVLTPLQAVLQGKPLTLASNEAEDCPPQDLAHPEDIVLSAAHILPPEGLTPSAASPLQIPALKSLGLGSVPRPPPGQSLPYTLPLHIPSTILLI